MVEQTGLAVTCGAAEAADGEEDARKALSPASEVAAGAAADLSDLIRRSTPNNQQSKQEVCHFSTNASGFFLRHCL